MANTEHLEILKQGVEVWNKWREENPGVVPDLLKADLLKADLSEADLSEADLGEADLSVANLRGADLTKAILIFTNFQLTSLEEADFQEALLLSTIFSNVDLTGVKNIETCKHFGPSSVDYATLRKSWPLPDAFLRGVGFPDQWIDFFHDTLSQPIQFYSAFISYSRKDGEFVDRLYNDLQGSGVRCWLDTKDLPWGAKTRDEIHLQIRTREKVILVLSENSINSDWVEREIELTLAEERRRGDTILLPFRIDNKVGETDIPFAMDIWLSRNVGDFREWKNHNKYREAFEQLLKWLRP
ncbi:MAG: toll/interleukin-1 receptor domain-containing protein [candidate division Zixibacteria bacterium]|nr:toll/interleukin-1 receptor domain-containing protein [Candidatus Tariuqbacter arcticus]